jgi:hypothetical protein
MENTALSNYWVRKVVNGKKTPPLCTECDPEIGKWHGSFSKRPATGSLLGDDGFLYADENVVQLPVHIKIVGRLKEDGSVDKDWRPKA